MNFSHLPLLLLLLLGLFGPQKVCYGEEVSDNTEANMLENIEGRLKYSAVHYYGELRFAEAKRNNDAVWKALLQVIEAEIGKNPLRPSAPLLKSLKEILQAIQIDDKEKVRQVLQDASIPEESFFRYWGQSWLAGREKDSKRLLEQLEAVNANQANALLVLAGIASDDGDWFMDCQEKYWEEFALQGIPDFENLALGKPWSFPQGKLPHPWQRATANENTALPEALLRLQERRVALWEKILIAFANERDPPEQLNASWAVAMAAQVAFHPKDSDRAGVLLLGYHRGALKHLRKIDDPEELVRWFKMNSEHSNPSSLSPKWLQGLLERFRLGKKAEYLAALETTRATQGMEFLAVPMELLLRLEECGCNQILQVTENALNAHLPPDYVYSRALHLCSDAAVQKELLGQMALVSSEKFLSSIYWVHTAVAPLWQAEPQLVNAFWHNWLKSVNPERGGRIDQLFAQNAETAAELPPEYIISLLSILTEKGGDANGPVFQGALTHLLRQERGRDQSLKLISDRIQLFLPLEKLNVEHFAAEKFRSEVEQLDGILSLLSTVPKPELMNWLSTLPASYALARVEGEVLNEKNALYKFLAAPESDLSALPPGIVQVWLRRNGFWENPKSVRHHLVGFPELWEKLKEVLRRDERAQILAWLKDGKAQRPQPLLESWSEMCTVHSSLSYAFFRKAASLADEEFLDVAEQSFGYNALQNVRVLNLWFEVLREVNPDRQVLLLSRQIFGKVHIIGYSPHATQSELKSRWVLRVAEHLTEDDRGILLACALDKVNGFLEQVDFYRDAANTLPPGTNWLVDFLDDLKSYKDGDWQKKNETVFPWLESFFGPPAKVNSGAMQQLLASRLLRAERPLPTKIRRWCAQGLLAGVPQPGLMGEIISHATAASEEFAGYEGELKAYLMRHAASDVMDKLPMNDWLLVHFLIESCAFDEEFANLKWGEQIALYCTALQRGQLPLAEYISNTIEFPPSADARKLPANLPPFKALLPLLKKSLDRVADPTRRWELAASLGRRYGWFGEGNIAFRAVLASLPPPEKVSPEIANVLLRAAAQKEHGFVPSAAQYVPMWRNGELLGGVYNIEDAWLWARICRASQAAKNLEPTFLLLRHYATNPTKVRECFSPQDWRAIFEVDVANVSEKEELLTQGSNGFKSHLQVLKGHLEKIDEKLFKTLEWDAQAWISRLLFAQRLLAMELGEASNSFLPEDPGHWCGMVLAFGDARDFGPSPVVRKFLPLANSTQHFTRLLLAEETKLSIDSRVTILTHLWNRFAPGGAPTRGSDTFWAAIRAAAQTDELLPRLVWLGMHCRINLPTEAARNDLRSALVSVQEKNKLTGISPRDAALLNLFIWEAEMRLGESRKVSDALQEYLKSNPPSDLIPEGREKEFFRISLARLIGQLISSPGILNGKQLHECVGAGIWSSLERLAALFEAMQADKPRPLEAWCALVEMETLAGLLPDFPEEEWSHGVRAAALAHLSQVDPSVVAEAGTFSHGLCAPFTGWSAQFTKVFFQEANPANRPADLMAYCIDKGENEFQTFWSERFAAAARYPVVLCQAGPLFSAAVKVDPTLKEGAKLVVLPPLGRESDDRTTSVVFRKCFASQVTRQGLDSKYFVILRWTEVRRNKLKKMAQEASKQSDWWQKLPSELQKAWAP